MSARLLTVISCDAPGCDVYTEQEDRFTPNNWYYLTWIRDGTDPAHYCSVDCLRRGAASAVWEPTHEH